MLCAENLTVVIAVDIARAPIHLRHHRRTRESANPPVENSSAACALYSVTSRQIFFLSNCI